MVAINKDARQIEAQVLAGRGGVREIGAILCDVLAQYGLDRSRTPLPGTVSDEQLEAGWREIPCHEPAELVCVE